MLLEHFSEERSGGILRIKGLNRDGGGYEKILLLLGEAPVLQLSQASYMNEMKFSYKYFSFSSAGKNHTLKVFVEHRNGKDT